MLCPKIQANHILPKPPDVDFISYLAFEAYIKIIRWSGFDMNGYPTLNKVEFVMEQMNIKLTEKKNRELINKIEFIHINHCNIITEMQKPKDN